MLFNPELHGQLARERIEREIAAAELLRQAAWLASPRRPSVSGSATGSSRSVPGSRRSPQLRVESGPARGPGRLPTPGDHCR